MASQVGIKETLNCKSAIEDLERGCVLTASVKQELVVDSSEADLLLGDIRNAFASSLDNLVRSNKDSVKPKAAVPPVSLRTRGSADDRGARKRKRQDTAPKEQHRKRGCISWEVVSSAADHDGYLWRKYGEKKINNNQFSRCYYRCTYYRDNKCKAKKQVQRQNYSDPPLYRVTYFYEHTCNINIHVAISNYMPAISYQKMLNFSVRNPSENCLITSSSGIMEEKGKKVSDTTLVPSGENPPVNSDVLTDHEIDFESIWFDSTDSGLMSLFGLE